ncbi:MAG: EthD family reductase [Rhizobiaceae bacterium]|nr:EthD family reductase [Rhizobiaceae bacterium]
MAKLIAIYRQPGDPAAFDAYYRSTHAPLAKTIPGLRHYDISRGPIAGASADGIYLVATLSFDSLKDIEEGLASPEGQATAADLSNFADGGVDLMMFETQDA